MQKIIIVIILITSFLNENNAQIQKGSWMLGGDLQFARSTPLSNSPSILKSDQLVGGANAEVGYFLSDKLAVGARVGFNYYNHLLISPNVFGINVTESNTQDYHLSPFARYYFTPKSKFKTFYELSVGGNWHRDKWADYRVPPFPTPKNTYHLNVKNTLGVNYFLTQNIALEGAIDYNHFYHINDPRFEGRPALAPVFPKLAFNPKFGIKVFLNTEKQDAKILADKYLKKGNMTIGLMSSVDMGNWNYGHFAPSIGYFLTDKWLISSSLSIFHKPNLATMASISPELRYYQPISPTTQLFFRGAVTSEIWMDRGYNRAAQYWKNSAEAGIGLNRFVSENLSVQGSVNLNAATQLGKTELTPNLKVGFQYFINR